MGVTNVALKISLATGGVSETSLMTGALGALLKIANGKRGTASSCRFFFSPARTLW